MKYHIPTLFFLCLLSCSRANKPGQAKKENSADTAYGTKLFESGFLKFADTAKFDSLKSELVNSFNIYDEGNNKIADIDAEELAECSFDFFLPNLNKILGKRGFKLDVQTANDFEKTNDILINGARIKLYTQTQLQSDSFWDAASRNFFKEVNRQLYAKKLDESFYLLYGGNDLHVLLLTAGQYKIIADRYKNGTKETPYLP
jgi:hypothetical protein